MITNYKIIEWSSIWNFLHRPAHEVLSEASQCVIGGSHGVYKWQLWAKYYGRLSPLSPADLEALHAGPEHEWYWEAAGTALNCIVNIGEGKQYMFYEGCCGGLFLFPKELPEMWSALNNKYFWDGVDA